MVESDRLKEIRRYEASGEWQVDKLRGYIRELLGMLDKNARVYVRRSDKNAPQPAILDIDPDGVDRARRRMRTVVLMRDGA